MAALNADLMALLREALYEATRFASRRTPTILGWADCALILTDHPDFDFGRVVKVAPLVVDTRNATWGLTASGRVIRF